MTAIPSISGAHRILLGAAILALTCLALASRPVAASAASPVAWSPCFTQQGPFECARVPVALDYDRPGAEKISIALTRLRATDPGRRIGSLFLNPGGPGGSGVDFVVGVGQTLYTPEVRARFDLVGFDPRGVKRSSPLRCFGRVEQGRLEPLQFSFPMTSSQEAAVAEADRHVNHACEQRGTRVIDHMSTANVARDLDVLRRAVGDDKLSYAGFSYGSYLGVTYANLFPDRVRAIVVDGVLDPVSWSTGRGDEARTLPFSTRLASHSSTQATLDEFFRLCDEAGAACAFSGDSKARFAALADRLRSSPLDFGGGFRVDYSTLIGFTQSAMYSSTSWIDLGQVLAGFEDLANPAAAVTLVREFTAKYGPSLYRNFYERAAGVACVDTDSPRGYAAWSSAGAQADEFSYFGRLWTWAWSQCAEWPAADEDRYMGPFGRSTAHPLLVVNPRFDPATRYEGAVAVNDLMPGSALLTVNGWGHTSLFMSACADAIVERYLTQIATPPAGASCEQDVGPFAAMSARSASATRAQQRESALRQVTGRGHAAQLTGKPRRHARSLGSRGRRARDAAPTEDALAARVGVDDAGNAAYAWTTADASGGVRAQARVRPAHGAPGAVIALSDPGAAAFDARVAMNRAGDAVFSWLQLDDAANLVLKTRSRSARGVLGTVVDVSPAGAYAAEHQLAIADDGTAVFVWTQVDISSGAAHVATRSRSAAGGLGSIAELSDRALDGFDPQVAVDSGGVARFAWTQGDQQAGRKRLQTRTRSAGGALGPVEDFSGDVRSANEAKLAVDRDGDAVLEWLVYDPETLDAVVHARTRSRNGTWGPIVQLSDPALDAWDPAVAIGANGDAAFTWWVITPDGARVEASSRPAGGAIGPRRTISADADDAYEPRVGVDADGDAVIGWLAFDRDGVRVQARRWSAQGSLSAATDLSTPAEDTSGAQLAVNDAGEAAFGWSTLDGAGYSVQGRASGPDGRVGPLAILSTSDRSAFEARMELVARLAR